MAKAKNISHFHILLLSFSAIIISIALLFSINKGSRAIPNNLMPNKEVGIGNCETKGAPVINVTQRIVKTVDSGEAGNNWAFDDLVRQIKVYKKSDNTFCALVDNEGRFDSQEGQRSPGDTGVLTGKEDGTFKGGYRALIVGTLKENPGMKTNGNLGTVNYNCDLKGNCPGYFNWVGEYFSGDPIFSYEWWGWQYNYKGNTWTNASTGNSGDII